MNNILKINKYILWDFRWAVPIFYGIVLAIGVLLVINTNNLNQQPNTTSSFGGFGMATFIFLFISGLNSFRVNFRFMLANNISRKNFFYGAVLAFTFLSAFMALTDGIFNILLRQLSSYYSLHEQLYGNYNFFAEYLWSLSIFLFAISFGWLTTMIYYRCNKLMKFIVSISPAVIVILLVAINNITNGKVGKFLLDFFTTVLGFDGGHNSYVAVLSFIIASIALFGISYLFIRKMPLKD